MTLDVPNLNADANITDFNQRLREEAHEDLADIIAEEPKSKTQIIAIYGKGGIGKSFTLANLSHMMAEQGKRVLLIGCDPKSDTTSLLFGGKACPTIIETSTRKKLAGEEVAIGDVCFKRGGVFAMELGGPEVGSSSWKSSASTIGISTTFFSISLAMWSVADLVCQLPVTWHKKLSSWRLTTFNHFM